VDLWWALAEEIAGREAACESLLTAEEVARGRRFSFAEGRRDYLATRTLERTVLSRYAPVEPNAWRFRPGSHGRPEIAAPLQAPLAYNLAHSGGLIACVVAAAGDAVGVDVESLRRRAPLEVADRFFAPSEAAALRALPAALRPRRFFDYWTLKESYIKARGLGLSLPLSQFAIALDHGPPPRVAFDPALADDPAWWEFRQLEPAPGYLAAVAVRRPPGAPVEITVRRAPLLA
jgi:4'-phosphopantetheinyl transferase